MKQGPLKGIKVLDFSQVLSAPFCGMMLADMGAEVIKVERPGPGDISREYGPYINDISLYFCQYNRGKKGIAIDMRSEEGKKVVLDLVAQVDVVVENFKAGTLEKLGIGYDKMLEVNPGLIYGSISGFGTYGPLSHLPCMDIIAAARSGLVAQSGQAGDAPIKPGFSLCDTWAGLQLLRGLSMALLHRQRTGQGLRVDIAMLDCAFYMCESPVLEHSLTGAFTERTGNHHAWYAPYGEFAAKDGNLVLAVSQESEWTALCGALGLASLAADPRFSDNEARVKNRDALIQELEKATKGMGPMSWRPPSARPAFPRRRCSLSRSSTGSPRPKPWMSSPRFSRRAWEPIPSPIHPSGSAGPRWTPTPRRRAIRVLTAGRFSKAWATVRSGLTLCCRRARCIRPADRN